MNSLSSYVPRRRRGKHLSVSRIQRDFDWQASPRRRRRPTLRDRTRSAGRDSKARASGLKVWSDAFCNRSSPFERDGWSGGRPANPMSASLLHSKIAAVPLERADDVQYRECKIFLKAELFAKPSSYHKFWKIVHRTAKSLGIAMTRPEK